MISPNEIKVKAERKYFPFLQSLILEQPFSRIIIRGDKSYSKSLSEYEKEILALLNQSKEKKGFGYTIDFQNVKTKSIGKQSLPESIYFDTEKDFLRYLGKEKEVELFMQDYKKVFSIFPELKDWIMQNPAKIIQNHGEWESILKVCVYFNNIQKPNLYIRELPIKVHTKFIERHQSIIWDLLEIIIEPFVNTDINVFERRFNLKYREPLVRFRILDKEMSTSYFSGVDDLSIPISQFERLRLPINKVIIVENKTTLYTTLTLPSMKNAIAIFGSGYSVHNLKSADWLSKVDLLYWGDIDVQGFEILSQFRGYFPNAKSILMDKLTFEKYFENDSGTPTNIVTQLFLNDDEQYLYNLLKTNNWRLEQEKIPFEYVNLHLALEKL